MRHAERLDNSANTNLSEAGLARASRLARIADSKAIRAVYSTNFCRTVQTVQPLASHLSLPIHLQIMSSSSGLEGCNPAIEVSVQNLPDDVNAESDFITYVLDQHKKETIIIAGHSNTVPSMISSLGDDRFDAVEIGHDDYEDVFVVTIPTLAGNPKLVHTTYDALGL